LIWNSILLKSGRRLEYRPVQFTTQTEGAHEFKTRKELQEVSNPEELTPGSFPLGGTVICTIIEEL
jgi:hypothetical protein